jgi:transcriptional adapter 3
MRSLSKESDVTIEGIIERLVERGGSGTPPQVPSGAALNSMREAMIKRCLDNVKQRTEDSDRLLRELQRTRSQYQRNAQERERERERVADRDADERKHKLKKVKKREPDEDRPPAVGAHGVARQDGVDIHKGKCAHVPLHRLPHPRPSLLAWYCFTRLMPHPLLYTIFFSVQPSPRKNTLHTPSHSNSEL